MKTAIVITTYNRPKYLKQCLDSLKNTFLPADALIYIIDDGSTDKATIELIKKFKPDCQIKRNIKKENSGVMSSLLIACDECVKYYDYVIILNDDAIVNNCFYDMMTYYKAIFPDNIISGFNTLTNSELGRSRHPIIEDGGWYYLKNTSGGLCLGIDKKIYETYFRPVILDKIGKNCRHAYDTNSTKNASESGCMVVCTKPSVAEHIGLDDSTMGHHHNPDISCDYVQNYVPMKDEKMICTVNIATYPPREQSLRLLISSLLKYKVVDKIRVYLNEYKKVPDFLINPKIETKIGENLKDSGKFYWADSYKNEYYFTFDDDLLPTEDYFTKHIDLINKHDGSVFVSSHGKVLKKHPISFRDVAEHYHCLHPLYENRWINLPGTGVMAFDNSVYKIPNIFNHHGMTDIWIARYCQLNSIPIICRAHKNELKLIYDGSDTLWNKQATMKTQHSEILNSITWKLYTLEA
jgi:glycosyltransferase involved in cell wall biosynthesis